MMAAVDSTFSMTTLQSWLPARCGNLQTAILEQPWFDMNNDLDVQLMSSRSRKRTHGQMSEESYNNGQSPWHHHFHPPRPNPAPDRLPPLRYPGDGYDFRRPAGAATPQEDVIDLTNEPETPPQRSQPRASDSRTPNSTRLPRFGRDIMAEVVDLEAEPDPPAEGPSSSPEVQFVGATARRQSSSRRSFASLFDEHWGPGMGMHTRSHPHTPFLPPGLGPHDHRRRAVAAWNWRHLPPREAREIETLFIGDGRPSLDFILDPDDMNLDYRLASFAVPQFSLRSPTRQDSRIRADTYKAPSPAPEGFTRTLAEDDVAVCPNCYDELGTGEGAKQEIWIAKPCGHVYCGECTENRSVSKSKKSARKTKPFSKCQVAGCGKTVSAPTAMVHLFL